VRLLADENTHPLVVSRLRAAGIEVEYVRETSRGMQDSQILMRHDMPALVFLTGDRDFGDLIFNRGYPPPRAILYQRLNRLDPDGIADRVIAVLDRGGFDGQFVTLTKDGERTKPFPTGA
jgi:predicted nuclease of predicted toxin-antitoxin system